MTSAVHRRSALLGMTALALIACSPGDAAPKLAIKVYKDPSCGCCSAWVDRMKDAGFSPTVEERADMNDVKERLGVPEDLHSCHTAEIAGYTIEGHVPPADVKRLVKQRPKARGIAVPGMPVNSPGMEVPGQENERYTVFLFRDDKTRAPFAVHGG